MTALESRDGIEELAARSPWNGSAPRAQWVYDVLRASIREGRIARGERIREEAVAKALGVSRTPVREALSRLMTRGLLELVPAGLVVSTLTRQQVLELYAMREILEGSAARFAAQHSSESEVASLQQLMTRFSAALGDPPVLAAINRDLHQEIYDAAHNRYLMRTLDEMNDALALLDDTTFAVPGRAEASIGEHAAIVDAIAARDADGAEAAARQHIRRAQEARLTMMRR